MTDKRLETALRDLMVAYAACNGEDHPAYERAEKLLAGKFVSFPPPQAQTVKPYRNDEAGYVEFLNEDRPYIVRDLPAPCAVLVDMETRKVIGYRVYDPASQTPSPQTLASKEELNEIARALQDLWSVVKPEPRPSPFDAVWREYAAEIRRVVLKNTPPQEQMMGPADQIIGQIEELFPNWRAYPDLVDCITCELHELRQRVEAGR